MDLVQGLFTKESPLFWSSKSNPYTIVVVAMEFDQGRLGSPITTSTILINHIQGEPEETSQWIVFQFQSRPGKVRQ